MNTNILYLKFSRDETRLVGGDYGKKVYTEQLEGILDLDKMSVIVFPEEIENISSSFVCGLFNKIISQVGVINVNKKIKIKANNRVKKKINRSLLYDFH